MDNIIDKFGIYDFFGLVIPGMLFLYVLIYVGDFSTCLETYADFTVLLVVAFVLVSYMCGIWMQEIGSFLDKNFLKIRISARRKYLDTQVVMSRTKSWFIIDYAFTGEELQNIQKMVEEIVECDINQLQTQDEKREKCEDAFLKCKAQLENMDKMGKAEKLNSMYAMGRDLIICNIGIIVCLVGVMAVKKAFELQHLIIIVYVILSSIMFYRRAKRFAIMRVKTILRQYMALKSQHLI